MSVATILKRAGGYGPILFGVAFIAPLIAQSLEAAGIPAPFGQSPIVVGLVIGAAMGTVAKLRGSWI